jgi:hypothetical protein
MEFSSSRSRDHKWKIPTQSGPIFRRHVNRVSIERLAEALLEKQVLNDADIADFATQHGLRRERGLAR